MDKPFGQQVSEVAGALPENIWESVKLSTGGMASIIGEHLGVESAERWGKELRQEAGAELDRLAIRNPTFGQQVAMTVGTSVGQAIPLIIAGFATRSPHVVTSGFGLLEFGRAYGDARNKGIDQDRAIKYAGASGLVEVVTEFLPTKYLFKQSPNVAARFAKFFASEIVGEETAEVSQRYLEWWGGLSEEPTMGELREIMALTAVAAPLGASIQAPLVMGLESLDRSYREVMAKPRSREGMTVVTSAAMTTAFHGSGAAQFSKFDMEKVGTGQGAQAFSYGLYVAEAEGVGRNYLDSGALDPRDSVNAVIDNLLRNDLQWTATVDDVFFEMQRQPELKEFLNDSEFKKNVLEAAQGAEPSGTVSSAGMAAYKRLHAVMPEPSPGNLYEVHIPTEAVNRMLDWDAPLSEAVWLTEGTAEEIIARVKAGNRQPTEIERLSLLIKDRYSSLYGQTGKHLYHHLMAKMQDKDSRLARAARLAMPVRMGKVIDAGSEYDKQASEFLASLGIPGVKYYDAMSRGEEEGTRNFVLYDADLITIQKVNGERVPTADKEKMLPQEPRRWGGQWVNRKDDTADMRWSDPTDQQEHTIRSLTKLSGLPQILTDIPGNIAIMEDYSEDYVSPEAGAVITAGEWDVSKRQISFGKAMLDAADKGAIKPMIHAIGHEFFHAIDIAKIPSGGMTSATHRSPLFAIPAEGWEWDQQTGRLQFPANLGPVLEEALDAWQSGDLKQLTYPLVQLPELAEIAMRINSGMGTEEDSQDFYYLSAYIQNEVAAQLSGLYFSEQPSLQKWAPQAYILMEELHAGFRRSRTNDEALIHLRKTLWADSPASDQTGGRTLDADSGAGDQEQPSTSTMGALEGGAGSDVLRGEVVDFPGRNERAARRGEKIRNRSGDEVEALRKDMLKILAKTTVQNERQRQDTSYSSPEDAEVFGFITPDQLKAQTKHAKGYIAKRKELKTLNKRLMSLIQTKRSAQVELSRLKESILKHPAPDKRPGMVARSEYWRPSEVKKYLLGNRFTHPDFVLNGLFIDVSKTMPVREVVKEYEEAFNLLQETADKIQSNAERQAKLSNDMGLRSIFTRVNETLFGDEL